ncbi:MAG: hypothetical protein HRU28_12040 [Rhizobiales bacterium]|nr:hypothetical protein [Hyphomicrobiales bacterium]
MSKKPTHTIADLDHALSVVAAYILDTGYDSVWPIIHRLEREKELLLNNVNKLEHYAGRSPKKQKTSDK